MLRIVAIVPAAGHGHGNRDQGRDRKQRIVGKRRTQPQGIVRPAISESSEPTVRAANRALGSGGQDSSVVLYVFYP